MFSSVQEQSASSEDSRGEEDVFVDCEGRAWQEGEGLSGRGPSPHAWHTQARPRTWPRSPELPRSSCPGLPGSPLTFAGVSAAGKVCRVGDPRPQSVFFFYVFILKRLSIYIGSCKDNREKLSAPPAPRLLPMVTCSKPCPRAPPGACVSSLWVTAECPTEQGTAACLTFRSRPIWGFQLAPVTKEAAMNIHVQVSCEPQFSFIWDKSPGAQLLDHMVSV